VVAVKERLSILENAQSCLILEQLLWSLVMNYCALMLIGMEELPVVADSSQIERSPAWM